MACLYLQTAWSGLNIRVMPPGSSDFSNFSIYFCPQIKILAMATTKITVNSNGSLKVEGDFEMVDKNGNLYDLGGRQIVSICRCGMSQNKPFCDGSHKGHFEHDAIAFSLPPKK